MAHKRQLPPLGLQSFRYVARPVQHTDHVNTVLVLQIEQEVIFKVLDGQHPDAVDKGYFRGVMTVVSSEEAQNETDLHRRSWWPGQAAVA